MLFDYSTISLPVKEVIPLVISDLNNKQSVILKAPPGAGKSTLVPLALLNEPWLAGKKIYLLEPRRLAAKTIALRMAELLGEEVGKTVGYRVRFENKTSTETKIEVLTEGILTRLIHNDNALEDIGLVIFDELHERSIHADVAMALCRETQQILRPDLRILVMSATLDMTLLSQLLDNAPTIESEGKLFPVDLHYTGEQDQYLLPELTAKTVIKAMKTHEGDVLVFFPGEGEIRKTEEILRRQLTDVAIHPLYGQLPQNKQWAAIMPDLSGKRKVVLATSIAETSLTIEGIRIVVDTGFGRTAKFDPKTGLSRLETVQISKDAADQRAGRAGRLSAGVCYRMWSLATQLRMDEHRVPEIMQTDLASLVLDLAKWGKTDAHQLCWLTPPPRAALSQAADLLHQLDALENNKITSHGEAIHRLPCHPRIAHMLTMAESADLLPLGTDIAALIDERDPLPRDAGIDINLRIEALRRYRSDKVGSNNFRFIEKVAESYRRLFAIEADNTTFDPYETGLLLAYAYPERIACARPGNNSQFQLANGKYASFSHKDDLAHEAWLAVSSINAGDGVGKIYMASPLNPQDLRPLVQQKDVIEWDTHHGGLIASRDLRIGSIVLQSTPLPDPDERFLVKAICEAIKKEGKTLLNFNDEVDQWQARILSLRDWNPSENWPDVSTPALLLDCESWLSPYLTNIRTPEALKKLDIKEIFQYSLTPEQQASVNQLAPEKLTVPSGSTIRITYQLDGTQPVLAVRLQECFGMLETPTVNNGKNRVLMHLLSPGYKVVQVTSDLKSFWDNTYFDVKKDLKRRYPKHSWPDNPLESEAVRGVVRRK